MCIHVQCMYVCGSICACEARFGICVAFIEVLKIHMHKLHRKQKTHLILHLVDCMRELGPSSAFFADRYI